LNRVLDAVGQEPDAVVAVSDAVKDGLDETKRESAGLKAEKSVIQSGNLGVRRSE
jgi:hypothetical protein